MHCSSFVKAGKRKVSLSIIQQLLLLILLFIRGKRIVLLRKRSFIWFAYINMYLKKCVTKVVGEI